MKYKNIHFMRLIRVILYIILENWPIIHYNLSTNIWNMIKVIKNKNTKKEN